MYDIDFDLSCALSSSLHKCSAPFIYIGIYVERIPAKKGCAFIKFQINTKYVGTIRKFEQLQEFNDVLLVCDPIMINLRKKI